MKKLRWAGVRQGGATVWRGWDHGLLLATVELRGDTWGLTLHRPDGDEERPERYAIAEGAQRKAEHLLWG